MKKLNQNDYLSEIVTDLGMVITKNGKGKHRCAEFRCICCNGLYIRNVYKAKYSNTGLCKPCTDKKKSTTHGGSKSPLYKVWDSMNRRCHDEKSKDYDRYGKLGVSVCDEWRNDFSKFRDWALSNGWVKGKYHIDKDILSEKLGIAPAVYSPSTCLLVTAKKNTQQSHSKRELPYYIYKEQVKSKKPYRVRVRLPNKKLKYCGSFSSLDEAIKRRDKFMEENGIVY